MNGSQENQMLEDVQDVNLTIGIEKKICKRCKFLKPLKEFSKRAKETDGLDYECRECKSIHQKLHYKENAEKRRASARIYRLNNIEKVREAKKLYERNNRGKVNAACRRWRENSPEKARASSKKYKKTHSEQVKAAGKVYRINNVLSEREKVRRWRISRPEKSSEITGKCRAKKIGAQIENVPYVEILERDQWTCQICHRKIDKELRFPDPLSRSFDHAIPLSLGGAHAESNIRTTHLSCNQKTFWQLRREYVSRNLQE